MTDFATLHPDTIVQAEIYEAHQKGATRYVTSYVRDLPQEPEEGATGNVRAFVVKHGQ